MTDSNSILYLRFVEVFLAARKEARECGEPIGLVEAALTRLLEESDKSKDTKEIK